MVTPEMSFRGYVGLHQEVWDKNKDGVQFSVEIEDQDGNRYEQRYFSHPRKKRGDRRWKRVVVSLSRFTGKKIKNVFFGVL